jgi:hypothetical protein
LGASNLPADVCAAIEVEARFPARQQYLPSADRIEERHAGQAELARARNAARAKAEGSTDQRLIQRALDVTHLAEALGAPGVDWPPRDERKEA